MAERAPEAQAFTQITVEVARASAESAEGALERLGALSVSLCDAGDDPLLEPLPGEQPLWGRVRVEGLFASPPQRQDIEAALSAALGGGCRWLQTTVPERDWVRETQASFPARRFGSRLWVCPSWDEAPPGATVVQLDPGLAFGTGTHPTTALCLEWLDAHPPTNQCVVDYGCGSGVLGIAAARLGADTVWATDIDPQALEATRLNAMRNRLGPERLRVCSPEHLGAVTASLVLANILHGPLLSLRETLSARLAPGGTLILSGLLREQAASIRAGYAADFHFAGMHTEQEWVLLEARRR